MTFGPGSVIAERYEIESELGAGGMGVVWRARDVRLGRTVAIKIMSASTAAREDALARFEREARVGAHVSHPHVIATYDFGRIDDHVFLVLQLVPHGDLRAYATARRPLPLAVACRAGQQIADALVVAHAAGVVHRDLKPENVLIEVVDPLHVRVCDFGMAFLAASGDARDGRVTHDGSFAGTPAYMSPEQIVDQQVGAPADVYALGCLVFELIVGEPPFDGPPTALIAKHVYAPPPRLASIRAVPSGLDELVDRMLAKSPALRPTAEAVALRFSHLDLGSADVRTAAESSERAQRMVSQQVGPIAITDAPPAVNVGVAGTLAGDVAAALGVAGFAIAEPAAVWLAVGASRETVAALVATGVPVVVSARRDEMARVTEWLRLGVADVVFEPIVPATLVTKLQGALARRRK